jgi:hypothetical protein
MAIFKFYLFIMTLISYGNTGQKNIMVIGKAENVKGGAVVISNENQKMYHVDGLSHWDESIFGKTVKVTGKLLVKKYDPPKKGDEIKQQMVGIKRIILKPKWTLIE